MNKTTIPAIPDQILLDADDTIFDWSGEMMARLAGHRDISGLTIHFDYSMFGPHVTRDDVSIIMESEDFWYSLPITDHGVNLLRVVAELPQDTMIVTSIPPRNMTRASRRAAAIAKVMMTDRLGLPVAILADAPGVEWHKMKAALAGPRKILVDDSPSNVDAFAEAGGQAILVPRPWNNGVFDPAEMLRFLCSPIEGVDVPTPRNTGWDQKEHVIDLADRALAARPKCRRRPGGSEC